MERNKSTQMCGRCINMYVVSALNHQPAGNMLAAIHRSHRSGSDYARRQKKQEENNMPPAFQTQLPPSVWPVFKSALVATVCVCQLAAPSAHPSSHSDSGLPFKSCTLSEFAASVRPARTRSPRACLPCSLVSHMTLLATVRK